MGHQSVHYRPQIASAECGCKSMGKIVDRRMIVQEIESVACDDDLIHRSRTRLMGTRREAPASTQLA